MNRTKRHHRIPSWMLIAGYQNAILLAVVLVAFLVEGYGI